MAHLTDEGHEREQQSVCRPPRTPLRDHEKLAPGASYAYALFTATGAEQVQDSSHLGGGEGIGRTSDLGGGEGIRRTSDLGGGESIRRTSGLGRRFAALLLLVVCPPVVLGLALTHTRLDGSVAELAGAVASSGLGALFGHSWLGSPTAWTMLAVFLALQTALLRWLPGPTCSGPPDATGHVPEYRANGLLAYAVTVALFLVGAYPLRLFSPAVVYDHFAALLGALNVASLGLCALLYAKGRRAPSPGDHGTSDSPIFDFFWGTELYPRILGTDVKQLVATRFGMIGWPVLLISFAAAQRERHGLSDSMLVAVGLQLVYVTKFFFWEKGYLRSMDIAHDRAGFYLCWGCLVWLPSVYTGSTLFLVDHPRQLGAPLALALFAVGVAAVLVNYLADRERQRVRATNGNTMVWGREPTLLVARYRTSDGEERENLLLASGFWGLARHFHYLPELAAAIAWTLPVGFGRALPWMYPAFLTVLLVHRAVRDDRRCAAKYGADWERYCQLVPYRIVPGIL